MRKLIPTLLLLTSIQAQAELPTVLTDTINKGNGTLNLLNDILPSELSGYLQSGSLYLGVDLNEAASGLESSSSVGVAIKDMNLAISTTTGDYNFSEFFTNTSAMITEAGSLVSQEFYTLFGTAGSNQINGGMGDYTLDTFDDVIQMTNIAFDGDIQSAQLTVTFLDTAATGNNEEFFDYSGGFEEFAVIYESNAAILDANNAGITQDTTTQVSFALAVPTGTPEPYWFLLLLVPLMNLLKERTRA